jgi:hypothetical protein
MDTRVRYSWDAVVGGLRLDSFDCESSSAPANGRTARTRGHSFWRVAVLSSGGGEDAVAIAKRVGAGTGVAILNSRRDPATQSEDRNGVTQTLVACYRNGLPCGGKVQELPRHDAEAFALRIINANNANRTVP